MRTNDKTYEKGTSKGMDISPKLQLAIEELYLEFLIGIICTDSSKQEHNPNYQWFVQELLLTAEKIWPGTNRIQRAEKIQERFQKLEQNKVKNNANL